MRSPIAARLIALLAMVALCPAASPAGLSTRLAQVDTDHYPELGVLLNVFTDSGDALKGLTKDDFTLEEDGQKVAIVSVDVASMPVNIALVLDMSGSMGPTIATLKRAAGDVIRNMDEKDRALLISFADKPEMMHELTPDRRELLDAIEKLKVEGATALFDALWMAIDELKHVSGRRMILLFTDGRDQNLAGTAPQSAYSAKAVAHRALDTQVPIWTIGLGQEVDRKLLARLAEVTGGKAYLPSKLADLRSAFNQAMTDVRLQYHIVYKTPKDKRDGTERTLAVTSASQGRSGQGRVKYLAPAAPPPLPPSSTVASTGGSGVAGHRGSTLTLTAQVAKLVFVDFHTYDQIEAWPSNMDKDLAEQHKVYHWLLYNNGGEREFILPPGSWHIEWKAHGAAQNTIPLGDLTLKAGQELEIRPPTFGGGAVSAPGVKVGNQGAVDVKPPDTEEVHEESPPAEPKPADHDDEH